MRETGRAFGDMRRIAVLLNQWTTQVRTQKGVGLIVRPTSPDDRGDVFKFLKSISASDLRFRFLSAVKPSEALAKLLTDVDHSSTEDLVAFDARDNSIAATAMIAEGHSPSTAEVAVLVRSDLKGQGIGWDMLREACKYASARGYRRVQCVESSSNERAITLEREQGFRTEAYAGDAQTTVLTKDLD